MKSEHDIQFNILAKDLSHVVDNTAVLWEELRGKNIFITGGTGFFGCWFLASFIWANEHLGLGASVTVLTRDPGIFKAKVPHLATNKAIRFHAGDVVNFNFPEDEFDYIIHAAATSAVATFNNEDPLIKFDTVVGGTRRVLDFAVQCGAKKVLYTSSGAVYGKQPMDMTHIPEDYMGAPDPTDVNSAWGESKRIAEFLCAYYAKKYGIEIKIARCFTFVGPYLPLDIHYAIGNFIRDGIKGGPIIVNGDGTPYRSYLYSSDLMVWLWTILFKGASGRAYNVGSEDSVTISQLAFLVARHFSDSIEVVISTQSDPNVLPDRYVPSIGRAQKELGLHQIIGLDEAIEKTVHYYWNYIKKENKVTPA